MLIQPLTPEIIEKRRVFRRKLLGLPGKIWRKIRRGLFWTLALGFVAHSALNIYASILLGRELAAIRQKGEPLKWSEMAPPAVPDSQNAALVYDQAFQWLQFSPAEKTAFNTLERNRTPQMNRDIEAALRKNQKALGLTRRAALMPQCRFPLNYATTNPTDLLFPYYGQMRELSHLLFTQAVFEAAKGDQDTALRDVRVVFKMSQHLSNEPTFIGFILAQTVDIEANEALARALWGANLSALQARAFQNSLPQTDWSDALRHALMGERSFNILIFETLRHPFGGTIENDVSAVNTPFWVYQPVRLLWLPLLKLDEVELLRLWKPVLAAPVYQQIPSPVGWPETRLKKYRNKPFYAMLTNIIFPTYANSNDYLDAAEVRHRERQIALALAVYRARKGSYPTQLSNLKTEEEKPLPLDPYSQKPFVYRQQKGNFGLYSIGVNRIDNGGQGLGLFPSFGLKNDDLVWSSPLE